jgi:hypothetical protein
MLGASLRRSLCAVADLYIVDFGGSEDEQARREAERDAESRRLQAACARYLVAAAAVNEPAARRVVGALFDWRDSDGRACRCGCHPRLSAQHGDGLDCRCTWDEARCAEEARRWERLWDGEAAAEFREEDLREESAIETWLAGQHGVVAERVSSFAPEQWEGAVGGHTFYFRERGGRWRIELDLRENGRFAQRLADVAEDGGFITEPVALQSGDVIAEGLESELGETPVDHIAFIVQAIRDHLWRARCDHAGALFFCPKCGYRVTGPSDIDGRPPLRRPSSGQRARSKRVSD